ncbi:HugZ family pyridoxamine 5'-phosphate oxidase [Snodgrassella communis]|jgi:heme iron utilization protein|uniref:HugZ family pyridoxamine 5'-phosphate oxidase n=1 Tax=Snodgrassella communis TaxID=2946699 RepID=UPI000C1EE2D9|nr:pyridoxamine 5'-phosphate oxidase family protein [Snodgrassella communis]PIT20777.1 hypothetical protein BGI35_08005 [Snodgrassella communis]
MSEQHDIAEIQAAVTRLQQLDSLVLATVGQDGVPLASYAPFAEHDGCLYVLLSGLSLHTQNLQRQQQANVMLIEDEASVRNIFARARLNYMVSVTTIEKDTTDGIAALQTMKAKLGKTVDVLGELPDFMLFRLQLEKARLVTGFGRAYVFMPKDVDGAVQLTEKNAKTE